MFGVYSYNSDGNLALVLYEEAHIPFNKRQQKDKVEKDNF